jgi:hypothetical protein
MDNFLRPVLIKRGTDLPLLLILLGVIGGLLAFGVLGLFLGSRDPGRYVHLAATLGCRGKKIACGACFETGSERRRRSSRLLVS